MTCRRRKTKCDEQHPCCVNCLRAGFVCEGYNAKSTRQRPSFSKPPIPGYRISKAARHHVRQPRLTKSPESRTYTSQASQATDSKDGTVRGRNNAEKRVLEEPTDHHAYALGFSEFEFQTEYPLPCESDSSSMSSRTWNGSTASNMTSAWTTLTEDDDFLSTDQRFKGIGIGQPSPLSTAHPPIAVPPDVLNAPTQQGSLTNPPPPLPISDSKGDGICDQDLGGEIWTKFDYGDLAPDRTIPSIERHRLNSECMASKGAMESTTNDNDETRLLRSQSLTEESPTSDQEILSIGNSMQTEITHPSPSSDHTMDVEHQSLGNLDHILNPVAYYEKLDELEFGTAAMMEIDSNLKAHRLTESEDSENQHVLGLLRMDYLSALQRGIRALGRLQTEGFCGRTLSMLVEDPLRPNIANTVHISLDDISRSDSDFDEYTITLFDRILGNEGRKQNAISGLGLIYDFLANLLPLALVSFSGSHVCRFDMNLWGQYMDEIPVGLGYSFQPRQLACLKDFICGPAWVLGKTGAQTDREGLKVSLLVQDLQELWGPVWLVGGTADEGPIIRTERGFIVPLPCHLQAPDWGGTGEVECHWTKEIPEHVTHSDRVLLRNTSRILIGTDSMNTTGIAVNLNCESQISEIQQHIAHQLQFPGTCNEYYTMEGHEIQLTGGQYVSAGFVIKHKRNPGKTLKASLLAECLNPDTDIRPLLKLRIGLEVSACTGNAQRVSLWDVLRLSQAGEKADDARFCKHRIADTKCIRSCWTWCRSNNLADSLMDNVPTGNAAQHTVTQCLPNNKCQDAGPSDQEAKRIMVKSIMDLQHTGIDPEGNLQAYWPFLDTPMNQRFSPTRFNKWLDILADTRDTSTFAVVSQRCLKFRDDCTHHAWNICPQSYLDSFRNTCLSLRLLPRQVAARDRGPRRQPFGLSPFFSSDLVELSSGSVFRVGKTKLYVKKTWQGQQNAMVAYHGSKLSATWMGTPEFREQVNPDIKGGEPVDVVICSKAYSED